MIKNFFRLFTLFFILSICAEQRIVVIIPSYNNAACYLDNLESVFKQNYSNFRVIYINDCSTDATGQLVEDYVRNRNLQDRIVIIHNRENMKAMANIYHAVHLCADSDLVIILDGDDAFKHEHVLATIERVHRERDAWISYAQYINVPEHKCREWGMRVEGWAMEVPEAIIKANAFRKHMWSWSGLRSFYAWIFKQIKKEDLIDDRPDSPHRGKFYAVCCDNAYFFPLLEMAGTHCAFIDEVLLLRNVDTPLNDFKINKSIQHKTALHIRSKRPYNRLAAPIIG